MPKIINNLPLLEMDESRLKQVNVAAGLVIRNGKILIDQRKKGDLFGGYWEFPGGKVEKGESEEDCVSRELHEELGIKVISLRNIMRKSSVDNEEQFNFAFYLCSLASGKPKPMEAAQVRWERPKN